MYQPITLLGKLLVHRCRPHPDRAEPRAHRFFDRALNCEPLKRLMMNTLFVSLVVWLSLISMALGQPLSTQALHRSAEATSQQTCTEADRNKVASRANAGAYKTVIIADMIRYRRDGVSILDSGSESSVHNFAADSVPNASHVPLDFYDEPVTDRNGLAGDQSGISVKRNVTDEVTTESQCLAQTNKALLSSLTVEWLDADGLLGEAGVASSGGICPDDATLVMTGRVRYAEPGCSDEVLCVNTSKNIVCSSVAVELPPVVIPPPGDVPNVGGCSDGPLRRVRVELWQDNGLPGPGSGDTLLTSTVTDDEGLFAFCRTSARVFRGSPIIASKARLKVWGMSTCT